MCSSGFLLAQDSTTYIIVYAQVESSHTLRAVASRNVAKFNLPKHLGALDHFPPALHLLLGGPTSV